MESSSSEPVISVDAAGQTETSETDLIEVDAAVVDIARTDVEDIALAPPLRADSRLDEAATAFDEFMLRKGFSENTIRAFRNDLKITVGFLSAETPLYQIRTEHLEEYLTWLQTERGKPCSAKTLARRITTLKVFFGWIHGIGVLGTDPAEPIVQQVARTPLPNILTYDESSRLMRAAQDYLMSRDRADARPYVLTSLLLQTGMKKAECARLLVTDINVERPQSPEVSIRYPEERNAHKNRTIVLNAGFVPALNQYLEQYQPENHLFDCTPRNLEYVLEEVGERANIRRLQVGFETLRWTCAVRDFKLGMPEEQLRQKMGLSKISWRETREKIYQLAGR